MVRASEPGAEAPGARLDDDSGHEQGRIVEVVFLDITETWVGRRVDLVSSDAGPSALCRMPRGETSVTLYDKGRRLSRSSPGLSVGPSDTTIEVPLPAGCRVQGTIATADGSPFVGRLCLGRPALDNPGADTEGQGGFDAGFVPEGTHALNVLCESGFVTVGTVDVSGEGTMCVHIAIRGSGSLAGEFVGDNAASFRVFRDEEKDPVAWICLARGPFEMGCLEPGSYVLRSDALSAPVRFNIHAWQRTDLGEIAVLPRRRVSCAWD